MKGRELLGRLHWRAITVLSTAMAVLPGSALASGETVSHADNAFIMVAAALVMLMIPGLALFYGGMSTRKNVVNTIMMSFMCLCLISVTWVLWGYTLAFGTSIGGLVGGLDFVGFKNVGMDGVNGLAHGTFASFQMMFAALTVALISGALVGRMRFSAFVIFAAVWATVVYSPLCHWVWGGGWIGDMGALDFAGGTVVHISSGVAALVGCLVLGARRDFGKRPMPPHHLPMVLLGTALLWFGWFGFNAGSALNAGGLAASAFMVTQVAAATAAVTWAFAEWIRHGKPTLLGAASGCVAGLVAITPAAGFVGPPAAIAMGFGGGILCFLSVTVLKHRLGYDDALDVFGIHGIGGTWGALATGIFAVEAIGGTPGLLEGNAAQIGIQAIGVLTAYAFVGVATFIILKTVNVIVPLRVEENDEDTGLDIALHGENGYHDYIGGGVLARETYGDKPVAVSARTEATKA